MSHRIRIRTVAVGLLATVAVAVPAGAGTGAIARMAQAAPGHDRVVSAVPAERTPNIQDGSVDAIVDTGDTVVVGGDFTRVRGAGSGTDQQRPYLFAFDRATGAIDPDFVPALDGPVVAIAAGPVPGTVYVAGRFSTAGPDQPKRAKLALLDLADGSVVAGFAPPAFNGRVTDLAVAGGRLLVGGRFTGVDGRTARNGLVSLDARTGAVDDYLTVTLTGNHAWTEGSFGEKGAVGVENMALSPDGSALIVIGNFRQADGAVHDQIVKINLGASATVDGWDTQRYRPVCTPDNFDSYVRDVAFSPDGRYFVVAVAGGPTPGTLCDGAARWETDATGAGQEPTWTASTGGDTLLSVAVSEQAVYLGGHQRWMNNDLGDNTAGPGAVPRPALAALDPRTGLPLAWNPGVHPRGFGVTELHLTPAGLWAGYDQEWIGAQRYRRERIAFFPLAGGAVPHGTGTARLPGQVYTFGTDPPSAALLRINAGGPRLAVADGGPDWQADTADEPSPYHGDDLLRQERPGWATPGRTPQVPVDTPQTVFADGVVTRLDSPRMSWDIPVPAGTDITLRLYFAGLCCPADLDTFHIEVDGVRQLADFSPYADVLAAAGGDGDGTMRSFDLTADGNLDIDLVESTGPPTLAGIEILRVPAPQPAGTEDRRYARTFDGSTAGQRREIPDTEGFGFSGARGGFVVGGTLFFGHGATFYRRGFDAGVMGPVTRVDPYSDPVWDDVPTFSDPGPRYAGAASNFYADIPQVTGAFYDDGRVYYTMAGQPDLYWRWFTPDSGVVGAVRTPVRGNSMADSGGVFASDDTLYLVDRRSGDLRRMAWRGGAPTGAVTTVSGPALDGQDWRAKVVFVAP